MFELMALKPLINSVPDARLLNLAVRDADISFENVVFEYVEGKRILNELSIQVGESTSFEKYHFRNLRNSPNPNLGAGGQKGRHRRRLGLGQVHINQVGVEQTVLGFGYLISCFKPKYRGSIQ